MCKTCKWCALSRAVYGVIEKYDMHPTELYLDDFFDDWENKCENPNDTDSDEDDEEDDEEDDKEEFEKK